MHKPSLEILNAVDMLDNRIIQ